MQAMCLALQAGYCTEQNPCTLFLLPAMPTTTNDQPLGAWEAFIDNYIYRIKFNPLTIRATAFI